MVRARTRHHRRLRHRRFQSTYLPHSSPLGRFRLVLLSPLVVVALSLMFNKQQGNAEPFQNFVLSPAAHSPAWVPTLAQASIPVSITRHGGQITLNGRKLQIPWSQRQQSLGIADAGLIEALGIELLDTSDVTQQPVEWFSDHRTTPLNLATWLTKQYRYVDISKLTQQFGWRVEVQGEDLQISTPEAQVNAVRQGPQTWGDRVVIDLDQAAPWRVSEQQGETTVTIDARLNPAVASSFAAKAGKQIKSLKLEANGNRTVLRLSYANGLRPRVWSLDNPNRLLIDVRPDSLVERNILWAPGVRWQQRWVQINSGRFPVVKLEVDPRQPGVSLRPIVSSSTGNVGTAPLSATIQRLEGIAAINAGFFNRNNQLPLGAIRSESRWISGPILNRGAIGWNDTGEATVGHLSLQETLMTSGGQRLVMQSTNSGYVGAGVARYTPDWGRSYKTILDDEVVITVRQDRVVDQKRILKAGQTTVPIPSDGYLLVVRADNTVLNTLAVGTSLQLTGLTQPDEFSRYAQVLGAGPLLLQNRRVVLNPQSERFSTAFIQEAAPRSMIATTAEGTLALLTVHNRVSGAGPTLAEIAQIAQRMGFVNALNLDGGSSTTLYLGGQLLNRSAATAAPVHNGIGVFIQPNS
ncbi:phosphodiester glycosidase family protein [Leptolyngbya sp. NK1-12]|uniref:Phosphodiester glycosidase family protein n=1 Tax=Leptolyngbya sp. NK1-12 TaxID=2547451 RepID=A0AA96W9R3_9CYAN|nr:phosphodiester glycosidase family protein [Leptolyngbya sp. NK1-12]WNZ22372.1 phosphodiester glycosidase family protein [Leptolyngbya sp. NK1-12]